MSLTYWAPFFCCLFSAPSFFSYTQNEGQLFDIKWFHLNSDYSTYLNKRINWHSISLIQANYCIPSISIHFTPSPKDISLNITHAKCWFSEIDLPFCLNWFDCVLITSNLYLCLYTNLWVSSKATAGCYYKEVYLFLLFISKL